jgi:hypothetical protein
MKNYLLALLVITSLASCKKKSDEIETKDQTKLAELSNKYNLSKIDSAIHLTQPIRQFSTVADFEKFLATNKKNKASINVQVNVDSSKKTSINNRNFNQTYVSTDDINYAAVLDFPAGDFPSMAQLGWMVGWGTMPIVSAYSSNLIYPGANFGSFVYTQTIGSAFGWTESGGPILFKGLYIEIYGVGGVYTYTRVFDVRIDCKFERFPGILIGSIYFDAR